MITLTDLAGMYPPVPVIAGDGKVPDDESLQRVFDHWEGRIRGASDIHREERHLRVGDSGVIVTDIQLRIDRTIFIRRPRTALYGCNFYGPDTDHLWFVICDPDGNPLSEEDVRIDSCKFESDKRTEWVPQSGRDNGIGYNMFPAPTTTPLAGWIVYGGIVAVKV